MMVKQPAIWLPGGRVFWEEEVEAGICPCLGRAIGVFKDQQEAYFGRIRMIKGERVIKWWEGSHVGPCRSF